MKELKADEVKKLPAGASVVIVNERNGEAYERIPATVVSFGTLKCLKREKDHQLVPIANIPHITYEIGE